MRRSFGNSTSAKMKKSSRRTASIAQAPDEAMQGLVEGGDDFEKAFRN